MISQGDLKTILLILNENIQEAGPPPRSVSPPPSSSPSPTKTPVTPKGLSGSFFPGYCLVVLAVLVIQCSYSVSGPVWVFWKL